VEPLDAFRRSIRNRKHHNIYSISNIEQGTAEIGKQGQGYLHCLYLLSETRIKSRLADCAERFGAPRAIAALPYAECHSRVRIPLAQFRNNSLNKRFYAVWHFDEYMQ